MYLAAAVCPSNLLRKLFDKTEIGVEKNDLQSATRTTADRRPPEPIARARPHIHIRPHGQTQLTVTHGYLRSSTLVHFDEPKLRHTHVRLDY